MDGRFVCRLLSAALVAYAMVVGPRIPCHAKVRGKTPLAVIQESHRQKFAEFSSKLENLEKFCTEKGLDQAAKKIRSRIVPPDLESRSLTALPTDVLQVIPATLPADEKYWQTQLRTEEKEYAKQLYLISRSAVRDNLFGYAFSLVREVALHDPDHPNARKILGFERQRNEWVTPFAASQMKAGNVWHEDFGWIPKSHEQRYALGDRYYKNRWVTKEKEEELRRDFSEAWDIRTDHYLIRTNVGLEQGVQLGKSLEEFHEFFYEMFAGFFNTPEQMKKLFDPAVKGSVANTRPYQIHFYRTREEYVELLRKDFPNIEVTNGIYVTNGRTVHFYNDPKNKNEATLFHEASHQLFYESHRLNRPIADGNHFWIVEGIACYMESLQRKDGVLTVGDPDYVRFADARINLLQKKFYLPLEGFTKMGAQDFQQAPNLPQRYTQAAGLTRFFMEYNNGQYREAVVKHLTQLYSGNSAERASAEGLDVLTGVPYSDLDQQYAEDILQLQRNTAVR